ncbi:MAG: Gfo/Idh/MocA family oxidoreductase [Armatimonadetes bacterium]|nr:Gfo/Idh/MocA family oxidoreductase [Armatimonadota bacterium]
MSLKCAMLGCGPRATGHAKAYELVTRGTLAVLCDMNEERLNAFGEQFGVATRYTDLDAMLAKEKPDVVHVVTPPTLRVGLMTQLSEAGVAGVIVEKPICIGADDYKALRKLEAASRTKFAVNHQLRHHPRILEYLADVAEGKLGEVRFLDASAVLPMSGQGVHVLDLMFAFNGYAPVQTVFGASSGYDDINGTHPSPRTAESLITFTNGARGALQAGEGAPQFVEAPSWGHKRIAVYGTHGFRHWRMYGYEKSLPDGSVEQGDQDYAEQDIVGQANLTTAMCDWVEDDSRVHPNNLATSLDEWLVILAGYLSTVEARPVDFPFEPSDDLLQQFQRFVGVA